MPQRLVEPAQELRLEARGKGRARLVHHLADAAQAQPAHEEQGFLAEAERGERQGLQGRPLVARGNDGAVPRAVAGNRPGGPRRIGDRRAREEPEGAQAGGEIGQQPLLPAEQMRAARDVEEQPVGAARLVPRRRDGRIAQAPERQPAQGGGIGGRVGIARLQVADLGAGVGEKLSLREAAGSRGPVERDDARTALARGNEHQRPALLDGVSRRAGCLNAQQARDRPRPQPNGNDARHDPTR